MKTKSYLFGFAVLFILFAFSVAPVAAGKPIFNVGQTALNAKIVVDEEWIDLGSRYSFYYAPTDNKGVDLMITPFLDASTEYALISYREPADASSEAFLASVHNVLKIKMSDEEGNLNMKIGTGSFLNHLICNTYAEDAPGDYQDITGAKVWLVPTSDLNINYEYGTAQFIAWNPDEYLFETDLITQTCEVAA